MCGDNGLGGQRRIYRVAKITAYLELLALIISGSIICMNIMNLSLIVLIGITALWVFIIVVEDFGISLENYWLVLLCGIFRIVILTGTSVVPIALSSYYQENTGAFLAIFGAMGVVFNPIKGFILIKAAGQIKQDNPPGSSRSKSGPHGGQEEHRGNFSEIL